MTTQINLKKELNEIVEHMMESTGCTRAYAIKTLITYCDK